MRKSSAAVVMDPDGRVLLQHRTDDAPTWPGFWGLFGGGLERGEKPKEALVRELREEVGLDASGAVAVGAVRADPDHIVYVFYLEHEMPPEEVGRLRAAQTEGQGMGLFIIPELSGLKNVIPCDAIAIGQALALRVRRTAVIAADRWREKRLRLAANGFKAPAGLRPRAR